MGIVTALGKLLLKEKKGTVGIIKNIVPTLGKKKTAEYLLKTAYKRGTSKGYAEVMAKLKKKEIK